MSCWIGLVFEEDCDKWRHRKWKGDNFPRFLPVFPSFFSGTLLDSRYEKWNFESNQSLAFWYLNPTNHCPSCFEFKTNQSYALDLNPTNGKHSLNGQSSTFRCTFVYLKVISRLDFKQYERHSLSRLFILFPNLYIVYRIRRSKLCYKVRRIFLIFFILMQKHFCINFL